MSGPGDLKGRIPCLVKLLFNLGSGNIIAGSRRLAVVAIARATERARMRQRSSFIEVEMSLTPTLYVVSINKLLRGSPNAADW